jgi:uncharacterized protein with von Willebrand factor type A (vWA) domain
LPASFFSSEGIDTSGLAGKVVRFADFLKGRGFRIFQSSVHESLRSLKAIDIFKRDDVLAALRANLVTNDLEWSHFKNVFDEFWARSDLKTEKVKSISSRRNDRGGNSDLNVVQEVPNEHSSELDLNYGKEWLEGVAYSPLSNVEKKDFGRFDNADIQIAQLALKRMIKPFLIQVSRRKKRSRKFGDTDFQRVMRKSLKTDGLPVELFYKVKKKRLKRLVILADVSGSMDRYARFVMPFMLGLRGIGPRAEVFVFSTSLTSITFMVRHLSIDKAIERIAGEVPDWSGGTRIGYSLHQFNQDHGRMLVSRRTVVVILSDGWDLGGKELLRREMEELSRKAYCVIWLNPLAGDPEYRPVCQGMRTALPFVDYFLPVDNLMSLKRVGRLLSRVMVL